MPALPLSPFVDALDQIRAWLEFRVRRREDRDERVDEVLRTIHRAANRTRAYLADVRVDPKARKRDEERALSEAWEGVGMALRQYKRDGAEHLAHGLSDRAFSKAEYWADPEGWTRHQGREAGIALDALVQQVLTLLDPAE
jgi:hypothetical protein